jgi:hypothetical protein
MIQKNKLIIILAGIMIMLYMTGCIVPPDEPPVNPEPPFDSESPADPEPPVDQDPEPPVDPDPEEPADPEPPFEPYPEEPADPNPEDSADEFNLFVDINSMNGECSDSYSRDENSLSTPFCTIQRAADIAEPGDHVRVERGYYEEYVSITRSGTSDAPIVFSGVRGSDGEWLTIIRGGNLVLNWDLAPEMDPDGYGVYKTNLGFRPYSMIVNNRALMHLQPAYNNYLSFSPNHIRSDATERVVFWDGIEGIYGYNTSTQETYVRFRNGDNPNNMNIYAAPSNSGVLVNDASNIIVRDFEITNMRYGVRVTGSQAKNVIIENNKLINSETRVLVTENAQRVHIRNNMIQMRWLSDEFFQGPWIGGSTFFSYEDPVLYQIEARFHLYLTPKTRMFRGYGIHLVSGSDHEIYENNIWDSYSGIAVYANNVKIYNNLIRNASSVGIVSYPGTMNLQVFNNEIYNVNIPLRFQNMHGESPRSIYIFNNKISSHPRAGTGVFFHEGYCNGVNEDNVIWMYHNSFSGYSSGLRNGCTERDNGLPNMYVVNNIISSRASLVFREDWTKEGMMGGVDYNWIMTPPLSAPWLGDNNIIIGSNDGWMWDSDDRSFILPSNSSARNSGLDLSKPFVLNGVTHEALPGMNPGYFSGNAPNMGAVQD